MTANVKHNWVFPVRNSPNISVMLPVSIPPPSSLSSSLDPVVTWTSSARFWWYSVAVEKPIGTNFWASAWRFRKQMLSNTEWDLLNFTYNNFICLGLTDSFDGDEGFFGDIGYWFYGVIPCFFQFLDISTANPIALLVRTCIRVSMNVLHDIYTCKGTNKQKLLVKNFHKMAAFNYLLQVLLFLWRFLVQELRLHPLLFRWGFDVQSPLMMFIGWWQRNYQTILKLEKVLSFITQQLKLLMNSR